MPYADIQEAKLVWEKMKVLLKKGHIVKEFTEKGDRKTFFPSKKENRVSHVRPHARNREDAYPLPVQDVLTGLNTYTKHCFWLNANYVKEEIFMDYTAKKY